MKRMIEIKEGTKLVACNELFIDDGLCLVKGNVYIVQTSDKENCVFSIIDEEGDIHCFDYSDVPNVWFNLYKPKKDPIVKQVTDKFKQRSKIGIEKYGTTLEENNTDDFYQHLSEELMDSLLYLQKLKSQSKEMSEMEMIESLLAKGYIISKEC